MTELEKVKAGLNDSQPVVNAAETFHTMMRKVYLWMTFALAISGLAAWFVASNPTYLQAIFSNRAIFWTLIIAELALVIGISAAINRISSTAATLLFILYSIVNGITLASIFVVYTMDSIASVFFITAGTFAAMAAVGYTTKKDLSGMGRFLLMGLIGIIIASIVNIFLHSSGWTLIINYVGVLIFVGLTAYDTQRIKQMLQETEGNQELMNKVAILGALTLYLDFINLFLKLLAIFGKRD